MAKALWHPLIVHLPLVALLLGTVFSLLGYFIKQKGWQYATTVLLLVGVIGIWSAYITGEWADAEVARDLCDPTQLKDHENNGFTAAVLFSIAAFVNLVNYFNLIFLPHKLVKGLNLILLAIGCYFLIITGHDGASLVYEQGAAVHHPTENCTEFE